MEAMRSSLFLLVLGACVLLGGVAAEEHDDAKLGDSCDYDVDCVADSKCNWEDVCECQEGFVPSADGWTCLKMAVQAGDTCQVPAQCSAIPSADCLNNVCVVTKAVEMTTTSATTTTTTTTTKTATATTGKPKEECSEDSECSGLLIKRVCNNGTCVPSVPAVVPKTLGLDAFVLNQACSNDSDCSPEGAACIEKRCRCKEDFVPSLNLKLCLQKARSVGDSCSENGQCLLLNGSLCENGKCSDKLTKIITSFADKIPEKLPRLQIGSSCVSDSECKHLSHSECKESVCQCERGFVSSVPANACLEKAKKEGDACKIDKQCEDIKEATCLQEKCVKPGVVGTKLGKKNTGSRKTVTKLILAAILALHVVSV